jgi:hypothetical protein
VVVPLLVPMSNMATDFNRADNVSLSKIRLKRLKGIKDFKTVSQLTAAFDTVNQDNKNTLVFVFNNLFWEPVVRKLGINQRDLTQYRAWINQLKDMTLQSLPRPYMFAFLTDLESAWNEFAEAFACACSDPCFGLPIHEKHLTLGTYPFSSNTSVRHHFLNSASVSSCRHSQERLKLLYERIFALINAARIGENLPFEPKITPSRQTPVALGKRAMPIYYKFDRDFRRKWLASNCPNTDDLTVLSYEQKDSLEFSLAEYDFFRVEGHLGLNVKTAYEKLNTMVNQFNLPFTILTLGLVQEPKKWPWWNVGVINHVDQIYFQIESKKIASDYFQTFKTLTATKNEEKKIVYSGKNLGIDDSVAKSFAANISMVATTNAPTKAFNTQITQLTKLTQDATTLFGKVSSPNVVAGLSTESLKLARDKMIDTNYSRQLSELLDALKERQLKAMLFDKFVERYRGLEPMNGVPRGGTLVLVFSSADENLGDRIIPSGSVVADFALPYYVDQVLTDELTIA